MALLYVGIGDSFFDLPLVQPGGGALEEADILQRLDTRWRIRGPEVFVGTGFVATEYLLIGTGLGTDPGALLPAGGTITGLYHYAGLLADNGGSNPFSDLAVERSFLFIDGLSIPAAEFAATPPDRLAGLLLAGDDAQRFTPTQPFFAGFARFTLHAGAGDDTLYGSQGDAGLFGDSGNDIIAIPDDGFARPNLANASLFGGEGDDTLTAGAGADLAQGEAGVDRLSGGRGNDTLSGGADRDILRGGDGNDVLLLGFGEAETGEILDGGLGTDRLAVSGAPEAPIDLSEALLQGIEILQLSGTLALTRAQLDGFARIEFGGESAIRLVDAGVTDLTGTAWYAFSASARLVVEGSAGRDVIIGRDSADVGPPDGSLLPVSAGDVILGGEGSDAIQGGSGDDRLEGGSGNDLLRGDAGADTLLGGTGLDTLDGGGAGRDRPDRLAGGPGGDLYMLRASGTVIEEAAGAGRDTVMAFVSATLPEEVEVLMLGGSAALDGTGNGLANLLVGNGAANRLDGGAANDTLDGAGGADMLVGGEGTDALDGGAGDDVLLGGPGRDLLTGGSGADLFRYVAAAESTPVSSGRDVILDFDQGIDRIDLSGLDADTALEGRQGFTFIGTTALAAGLPGQLRYEATATGLLVQATLDGDRRADFALLVQGAAALTEADFLLG